MAMLVRTPESMTITGTATVRNLVLTSVGFTLSEITTACLPVASLVTAALAAFGVTRNPMLVMRCCSAASPAASGIAPTTNSTSGTAVRASGASSGASSAVSSSGTWAAAARATNGDDAGGAGTGAPVGRQGSNDGTGTAARHG